MGDHTIARVAAAALALVWLGSCGMGCRTRQGKPVDLVKEWGLDGGSKVTLTRKPTLQTITLQESTEIQRFFENLSKAVEGGDEELMSVGFGEVEVHGGSRCMFGVLLHGRGPRLAVQRYMGRDTIGPHYYVPKELLNLWKERLGLPD